MKTRSLRKFAWVFFALVLTTATVFAQGRRRANTAQNNQNLPCLTQISNLSDQQKAEIEKLETDHQKAMADLSKQRRSTTDAVGKSEIRTTMLKNVEAHRNEVKALLNENQQLQYDQLQASAGYGKNQSNQGRGNANFKRQGSGNGNTGIRGQGNACGNHTYARGQGRGKRVGNQGRQGNCIQLNNN
ncbi:Spy/CpxP family protein refolding chaperone [Maribellus sediminis]|uniref:Spy/CpxP family protein refolding chaperone n=1 Tax=Maribellus sediminis TaxID=2696285 RepID=UPI001430C67D|nr:hypothetical protein [Maribellus sediminis]